MILRKWAETELINTGMWTDEEVRDILKKGTLDGKNRNELYYAWPVGWTMRKEAVESVLAAQLNINNEDKYGSTVVHHAARLGLVDILLYSIFNGANVNADSSLARTPLQQAVKNANIESVENLLAFGANETVKLEDRSLLSLALEHSNDCSIFVLLLEMGFMSEKFKKEIEAYFSHRLVIPELVVPYDAKTDLEKQELRETTLRNVQRKVGIRLMKFAHPQILDYCIALAPLQLPAYVMLWIFDELPNYYRVSHIRKIRLIEGIVASIRKIKSER